MTPRLFSAPTIRYRTPESLVMDHHGCASSRIYSRRTTASLTGDTAVPHRESGSAGHPTGNAGAGDDACQPMRPDIDSGERQLGRVLQADCRGSAVVGPLIRLQDALPAVHELGRSLGGVHWVLINR
jgi:hypothetical protein